MFQLQNFDSQVGQPQKKPIALGSIPPARPEDLTYQRFDGEPTRMKKIYICLDEQDKALVIATQVEERLFHKWVQSAFANGVDAIAPDQSRYRYSREKVIGVGDINSIPAATLPDKPVFQPKGYSWCLIN